MVSEFSSAGVHVTAATGSVPLPVFKAPVPARALCNAHTTRPDMGCRRCVTALEVTGRWRHEQGRCVPEDCPHCEFAAGDITAAGHRADIG